ncbi:hypothetical protein PCA20602_04858 [Pandoraea capi]|uniref:N-acetyltransferase domain-containing protein n=1 Tax=Pandoraea capi TaxID=2508286 RepID=A0ABY6WC03_9BURK|nr:hypothetical protein [Pandoraea capi]VVE53291.1 hypothetical protein PCA20602_04858 [Pandoraea capi]
MISANANASTARIAPLPSPADNRSDDRPTPEMAQDLHSAAQMHGAPGAGIATGVSAQTTSQPYSQRNGLCGVEAESPAVQVMVTIQGFAQMTIDIRRPQAGTLIVGEAPPHDRIAQDLLSDGQEVRAGVVTMANQGMRGARSLSVTPVLTDGDLVETFVKAWGEAIDSQGEPDGWGRFLTEGGAVFFGGEDRQALLATLAKNIHRLPEDRRWTGMKYILEDKSGLGVAAVKSVVSDRGLETVEVFAVADRTAALDLYYKHGIIQLR